ncbi:MAG TPA: DUF4097 family beta strand repeat-containing protein [Trebonia sp.]|nr:DUF4097 family beta strand repeat-containing protein [Trebonia sp.]
MTSAMWANSGPGSSGEADPGPAHPGPQADPGPVGGGLGGLGGLLPAGRRKPSRLMMTPARRAAILIGVPIVFLILITGGYSVVSNGGTGSFPVSKSLDVVGGKLTVSLGGGGNATLHGSHTVSATARLAGTVRYHLKPPTLNVSEDNVSLDCPKVDAGNCTLDATIDIPAGVGLALSTGGGNLSASDLSSGGTLGTDGGSITLNGTTGNLVLDSGGGNVVASHASGPAVRISTDGGEVSGSGITAGQVTVSSGGGDVTLALTRSPHDLQVTSDGGNVTIVVPRGQYIVNANADGGNVNPFDISSTRGAADLITVQSGGGNISVTPSGS